MLLPLQGDGLLVMLDTQGVTLGWGLLGFQPVNIISYKLQVISKKYDYTNHTIIGHMRFALLNLFG